MLQNLLAASKRLGIFKEVRWVALKLLVYTGWGAVLPSHMRR